MGSSQSSSTCKEERKRKGKPVERRAKVINYNEPVHHFLCLYFFRKRRELSEEEKAEMKRIEKEESNTEVDPILEAKARKFARLLYFHDEVLKAEDKKETERKALELERRPIPIQFRMYDWGNPAPVAFTERVMRQEARIALCVALQNFDK